MAMQWTTLSFPFQAGISNKHEEKAVPIGKLEVLENAIFNEWGSLQKRNGFTILGNDIYTPFNTFELRQPYQLFPHKDSLMIAGGRDYLTGNSNTPEGQFCGPKALTYSDVADKWIDSGTHIGTDIDIGKIGPDVLNIISSDIAASDNYYGYVFHNTSDPAIFSAGAHFSIFSKTTGKRVVDWTQFFSGTTRTRAKVVGFTDRMWMIAADAANNDLFYYEWLESAPFTTVTETAIVTDLDTDDIWDVFVDNDELHVVYKNSGSNSITYKIFNSSAAEQSTFNIAQIPTENVSAGPAWGGTDYAVVFRSTTNSIQIAKTDGASLTGGPYALFSISASDTVHNITVAGSGYAGVWVDYTVNATGKRIVKLHEVNSSGTDRSFTGRTVYGSLASKAFNFYIGDSSGSGTDRGLGQSSAWIATESTEQSGFYLLGNHRTWNDAITPITATADLSIYAKCFYQSGDGFTGDGMLPGIIDEGSDQYSTSLLSTSTLLSDGFVRSYVNKVKTTMKQKSKALQTNETTLLSGGFLSSIRGGVIAEDSLFQYPNDMTLTGGTTGGSLTAGTYGVIAIYEWRDRDGILHRTAPTTPVTVALTTATSKIGIDIDLNAGFHSNNMWTINPIRVIYRTEANGSVYYRDTESNAAVDLTQADSTLTDNELLYTTGGVLGNFSPPPSSYIWANKDRVFLLASDEDAVWYSKTKLAGTSWGFNPIQKIVLSKKPIAGADQDGRQIIFFSDSIAFFTGEGPNNLGVGVFTKLENIPTTIGCTDKHSVLNVDNGIMFKSESDFYLLDRSLQVVPVGLDVSDYNSETVLAAVAKDRKAYFAMSGGDILVYDWLIQQWSVHKLSYNTAATASVIDICVLNDTIYTLAEDSTNLAFIQKESTSTFTDSGNAISLKATTGWIQLTNNKSGWVRVRRLSLLGEKKSDHTLTINIYQDYNDTTPTQTETVDASLVTDEPYLLRVRLDNQKCSAIKVEVSDSSTGENYSLSELVLEVGQKRGINRTKSSKTF